MHAAYHTPLMLKYKLNSIYTAFKIHNTSFWNLFFSYIFSMTTAPICTFSNKVIMPVQSWAKVSLTFTDIEEKNKNKRLQHKI